MHVRSFAALALLLILSPAARAQTEHSSVRYSIHATVDGPDVAGEETIEIDPTGAAEMNSVVLFLFPNVLTERQASIDSKTFFNVTPVRWRRGGMTLTSVTGENGEEL